MKIKDVKKFLANPNKLTRVNIIDLFALGTITKDKTYVNYLDFLEDEKNEEYELIDRESIEFWTFENGNHIDLFIDTRKEREQEDLL